MDGENGERLLWQNAYSLIADRVRGIVGQRRVQHAFQQMQEHHRMQQHQCEESENMQHSFRQNSWQEGMTEQRQFVLSSEGTEVDYLATAAAECEMTSGAEAGCSCLMHCEEDQQGRVGLFASGALPSSSCTGRIPEETTGRGGAAAPLILVSCAATASNLGKPSGDLGNNAGMELVNSRQNEKKMDGFSVSDEQRWAKLQPNNCNNNHQVQEVNGCNAASLLSLATRQQGKPNMTSLINASTLQTTAASAQPSCIVCPDDDYTGSADDTSPSQTALCVAMETRVRIPCPSSVDSPGDTASAMMDTGHCDDLPGPSTCLSFQQPMNEAKPNSFQPSIDHDSFDREHSKHGKAVLNNEHMVQTSAACSAGDSQILHNSSINTQETNQYFHTAETGANSPVHDQTFYFETHVPNAMMSCRNANDQEHAGARMHLMSSFGAESQPNSCAKLTEGLIRENAGGFNLNGEDFKRYSGDGRRDTISSPIDKVSQMHNTAYDIPSSNFNNDAGPSILLSRGPDNEMAVDCCEQSLENHDAVLNPCPSNNISSAYHHGRVEQTDIGVARERETQSQNFQPSRRMEEQVMVVLNDLQHSIDATANNSRQTVPSGHQFRCRKATPKCTDICNGHDVVFPSEMDSGSGTTGTNQPTCCSTMNNLQQTAENPVIETQQDDTNKADQENIDPTPMDIDTDHVDGGGDTAEGGGAYGGDVNATGPVIDNINEWTTTGCGGSSRRSEALHCHLTELDQTDIFRELDAMCRCSIEDILAHGAQESHANDTDEDDIFEQQATSHGNFRPSRRAGNRYSDIDGETRQQRPFTSHTIGLTGHARAQLRFGLPNLNLVQLFRNLLRNFYYETFIWMYLNIIMHPRSTTTRNRLRFLGLLSNQSMEAVLLNVLLGYFNGFHASREATIREGCRVLGEISGRGGGYVNSRQAVWLRELAVDIGIHYSPRQMIRAFSSVVRDILMTRVPPVYCVRYVSLVVDASVRKSESLVLHEMCVRFREVHVHKEKFEHVVGIIFDW